MNLTEYFHTERGKASGLALALGVDISYLSQMASGYRSVSPARAVQIEALTSGAVSRKDLRSDWQMVWPELVTLPQEEAA